MADRKPGDFIKTVKITGERHNLTFPVAVMKVLGVEPEDYLTFYLGDRPGEVIVRRTSSVSPSPTRPE